ncbi:4686_t:CDS:1, partial [Paraglomus brasilianum]
RKSGIIVVFSVKSEREKEQRTSGLLAFKIGFYFIFVTGVEFLFFGVKEGEVEAILGILEAVIG